MNVIRHRNLKESTEERGIAELGPHLERHVNSLALLGDEGHRGAEEFVRAVTPSKKTAHGSQTH